MCRWNKKTEKGRGKMKIIKKAKIGLKRLVDILMRPDMLILPGQLAFFFL